MLHAIVCLPLLCSVQAAPDPPQWGDFRGPGGAGVVDSAPLPEALDPEANLRWRTELPPGYSSPTVAGDRIFLTAAEGQELMALCLDRHSGKELWRRVKPYDGKRIGANSAAAPTPVTDGVSVFVLFHSIGLLAYDLEGEELWAQPLGPFQIPHGMSTSPLLHGELLIQQVDQDSGSYLAAFDKRDGELRWKTERSEFTHAYSTPTLYTPEGGPAQVIVSGSLKICAYSVADGELLWWIGGSCFMPMSVPIVAGDHCYVGAYSSSNTEAGLPEVTGSFAEALADLDADGDGKISPKEFDSPGLEMAWFVFDLDDDGLFDERDWDYLVTSCQPTGGLFAIQLGGAGDVTESHVDWKYDGRRGLAEISSPILVGGTVFMIKSGGLLSAFDPASGELVKIERVGKPDMYFASPVSADGKLILASHSGQLTLVSATRDWEVLCTSDLGEEVWSTPAIVDGRVYVRSQKALYCFE